MAATLAVMLAALLLHGRARVRAALFNAGFTPVMILRLELVRTVQFTLPGALLGAVAAPLLPHAPAPGITMYLAAMLGVPCAVMALTLPALLWDVAGARQGDGP